MTRLGGYQEAQRVGERCFLAFLLFSQLNSFRSTQLLLVTSALLLVTRVIC